MKTQLSLISILLSLALSIAACSGQPAAAAGPEAGSVEDYASLVEALRVAGATVEPGDSIEQIFFAAMGQIIKVNGVDVQVFEYETAEAMEADAAPVAPDGGSIGTNMVTWVAAPHFYKAGRILVLHVGEDEAILDLLEGVLGPQFAGR